MGAVCYWRGSVHAVWNMGGGDFDGGVMGGVTEWFSVQQAPPTVGWYEYDGWLIDEGTKLYWNGSQWGYWVNEQPRRGWTQMAGVISDKWRGIYAT